MTRIGISSLVLAATVALSPNAGAVRSAELYTSASYGYGRMEARLRFAAGDGVVSSFFSWKEGSELADAFWNEIDFEKVGANCLLKTNPLYGNPEASHGKDHALTGLCSDFHVYAYEWTPEAIVWTVDGVEVRRETGETAAAFADNATAMQVHFNVWPGDATFGGNFDPAILPVHQYIDWVAFSSYSGGTFTEQWREDFDGGTVPAGWLTGSWASPKNLSTHDPGNVNFLEGYAILSLTADDAVGPAGALPITEGAGGASGAGGAGGSAGGSAPIGGSSAAGATGSGGAGGAGAAGASGGVNSSGGAGSAGGPSGGAGVSGTTGSGGGSGATTGAGGAAPSNTEGSCSLTSPGETHRGAWLAGLAVAALAMLRRRTSSATKA